MELRLIVERKRDLTDSSTFGFSEKISTKNFDLSDVED